MYRLTNAIRIIKICNVRMNVPFKRFRPTIVAVEKKHVFHILSVFS